MAEIKNQNFIKLKSDFFNNPEIILLKSKNNGVLYICFYLWLLCNSKRLSHGYRYMQNCAGRKLGFDDNKSLSILFEDTVDNIKDSLKALEKVDLITIKGFKIIIKDINIDPKRNRTCTEYTEWRKSIFERDNYTCQHCKKRGGILNAHHIKAWAKYPKLRFDIDNGITLCEKCHRELHKQLRRAKNG